MLSKIECDELWVTTLKWDSKGTVPSASPAQLGFQPRSTEKPCPMLTAPLPIVKRDDDGSGVVNRQISRKDQAFVRLSS